MMRVGNKGQAVPGSENALEGLAEGVIEDLVRVGLVAAGAGASRLETFKYHEALNLFSPLLTHFDVRLRPMSRPGCPVWFCTGILKMSESTSAARGAMGRGIPAGGQGMRRENAAISCLGELAERVSLCGLGPEDPRTVSGLVKQPEVDLTGLLGLSAAQEKAAARGAGVPAGEKPVLDPGSSASSVGFVPLRNLISGEVSQLPSFGVLFQGAEQAVGPLSGVASSTGCAVWPSLEGARERALLEFAERDAVAQMWYNRLGINRLGKTHLQKLLPSELYIFLNEQSRGWGVYVIETDLAVQVAMAVSFEPGGGGCAFGSSAGWDLPSACTSAIEEMLQSENSLALMDRAYPVKGAATDGRSREPRQLAYARRGSILDDLPLMTAPTARGSFLTDAYSYADLLQSCADAHIEIWEFDATRPDLGIPCIKLLSPDLCTWEPRFGRRRLFQGVVDRGLRASPASEQDFAARPFPF